MTHPNQDPTESKDCTNVYFCYLKLSFWTDHLAVQTNAALCKLFLLDSFPNDLIPAAVQGKGTSGFADQTGVSHPSLSLVIKCDRFVPWKYLPKVRVYPCLSMSLSGQEANQPENYQLGLFGLFDTQFQFYNQICTASSYFNCLLARKFISV